MVTPNANFLVDIYIRPKKLSGFIISMVVLLSLIIYQISLSHPTQATVVTTFSFVGLILIPIIAI